MIFKLLKKAKKKNLYPFYSFSSISPLGLRYFLLLPIFLKLPFLIMGHHHYSIFLHLFPWIKFQLTSFIQFIPSIYQFINTNNLRKTNLSQFYREMIRNCTQKVFTSNWNFFFWCKHVQSFQKHLFFCIASFTHVIKFINY